MEQKTFDLDGKLENSNWNLYLFYMDNKDNLVSMVYLRKYQIQV